MTQWTYSANWTKSSQWTKWNTSSFVHFRN